MSKTSIEWADHSINPFRARNLETGKIGHFCVKVSPGCKNCYSSKLQSPYLTQLEFVASNRSKVQLFLEENALDQVLRRKTPTRYFWCDMTDMFLDDYPDAWIWKCLEVMRLTPQHTHMVLTKRADRLRSFMGDWASPLPNLWLGVSVENYCSTHGDERRAVYWEITEPNGNKFAVLQSGGGA